MRRPFGPCKLGGRFELEYEHHACEHEDDIPVSLRGDDAFAGPIGMLATLSHAMVGVYKLSSKITLLWQWCHCKASVVSDHNNAITSVSNVSHPREQSCAAWYALTYVNVNTPRTVYVCFYHRTHHRRSVCPPFHPYQESCM